ncbi:MAG: glutamate-5-semialdehyde dehydrogenase [Anaerostipes sp.]|uniref:glutamate-5-semialdehyde dehydrogenase n=1 Tax=Anaerostipes sp. TaxID=1872530 RepID=UPI0039914079
MLEQMGKQAREASVVLGTAGIEEKNAVLKEAAKFLVNNQEYILAENAKDVENAKNNGMTEALIDRLALNSDRIEGMAEGLMQVAELDDPIGAVEHMNKTPNGMLIGKKVVPLGVVGIIYESRPNVTADAFALCFKTGNACLLRGGSDAINSNLAITNVIQSALESCHMPKYSIQLLTDTSRETATKMMQLNEYLDVLIPRGGAGLIQSVVKNSTVPVIETGTGNCHVYVDEFAQKDMAVDIIINAKTQRLGTCNTCESLVLHKNIVESHGPAIVNALLEKGVEVRGDEAVCALNENVIPAQEEDWGTEYLDAIISIKTVDTFEEAVAHINHYNTGHSEAIITDSYQNAQAFLDQIDAAAVYVNASTRFTDGFEFGFGAEIGISTQKIHARGPMGLWALTTTKFIIYGNGQIRK